MMGRLPRFADQDPDESYYDPAFDGVVRRLRQGGCQLAEGEGVLTTLLGSCVAVCLRDTHLMIGGMVHFVLPGTADGTAATLAEYGPYPYGEPAMAELHRRLMARGATPKQLEAKVFGGGEVVSVLGPIGWRNIECVETFMRDYGIPIVASDLGGTQSRRLYYQASSGRAWVRRKGDGTASDAGPLERPGAGLGQGRITTGNPTGDRR
jgi:chemotaxis protein CheD